MMLIFSSSTIVYIIKEKKLRKDYRLRDSLGEGREGVIVSAMQACPSLNLRLSLHLCLPLLHSIFHYLFFSFLEKLYISTHVYLYTST